MLKALMVLLFTFVLFWILHLARGLVLTPVYQGKSTFIEVVVHVRGAEPGIPQTVDGIKWLSSNGTLRSRITVVDEGMDTDTREISEKLRRDGHIELRTEKNTDV